MNSPLKETVGSRSFWLNCFTSFIFVSLVVFFALYTDLGISPDGLDHLNFSINNIPKINLIGAAQDDFPIRYIHFYSTGYGYHYLLNLVYHSLEFVSSGSINETYWLTPPFLEGRQTAGVPAAKANLLVVIRLLSVILTCLQVYMLKKICEILEIKNIYPLTLLWLSLSMMFPFLHGNASRDVLVNFLSICFVYNVLAFHIKREVKNIKYALLILAIAPFVQLSLCAFLVTVLASYALLSLKSFGAMICETWKIILFKRGYLFPVLLGIVAIPATTDILNKTIHYKSIKPRCVQMFSYDECMEKNATFKVYQDIRKMKIKQERIDLGEYFEKWYPGLFMRIFGIMGHRSYISPKWFNYVLITIISLLFILSATLAIIYKQKNSLLLGLISLFYFSVIFYFVNRKIYLFTGVMNTAFQGRYVFPVYPLMVLFAHSCFGYFNRITYYLYVFLLFGILSATYFMFIDSIHFGSILAVH
jgi:hypothetical protein